MFSFGGWGFMRFDQKIIPVESRCKYTSFFKTDKFFLQRHMDFSRPADVID